MGISFNNILISSIEADFFRQGTWCADCIFVNDPKVGTKSVLIIDDVQYIGTVISSVMIGPGSVKARIVGGNGKLTTLSPTTNLIDTTGIQVLNKIIGTNEILKPPPINILTFQIKNWEILANIPLGIQLSNFLRNFSGHVFRINKLGLIEIIDDQSLGTKTILPTNAILTNTLFNGSKIYSVSNLDKMIEPGSITEDGWMVEQVSLNADFKNIVLTVHKLSIVDSSDVLIRNQNNKNSYNASYACRVDSQNTDGPLGIHGGTLKLFPDDPRIQGGGLNNVPIKGFPGMLATVSPGSRCFIQFNSEDPSKVFVAGFECIDGNVELITIGNPSSAQYVALSNLVDTRISDVETKLNTLITKYSTHTHPTAPAGPVSAPSAPETPLTPGSSTAATLLKTV